MSKTTPNPMRLHYWMGEGKAYQDERDAEEERARQAAEQREADFERFINVAAAYRHDRLTPELKEQLPGIDWRRDSATAQEELLHFAEENPDIFLVPGGVDHFLENYPSYIRPALKDALGQYLQPIVDVEYRRDPYAVGATVPYIAPSIPGLTGTRTPRERQNEIGSFAPYDVPLVTLDAGVMRPSPAFDSPAAAMYLQKRRDYGIRDLEPEQWKKLADEHGGHTGFKSERDIMQRKQRAMMPKSPVGPTGIPRDFAGTEYPDDITFKQQRQKVYDKLSAFKDRVLSRLRPQDEDEEEELNATE